MIGLAQPPTQSEVLQEKTPSSPNNGETSSNSSHVNAEAAISKDETTISKDLKDKVGPEDPKEGYASEISLQPPKRQTTITFDSSANQRPKNESALYIPGPRERDRGMPEDQFKLNLGFHRLTFCRTPIAGARKTICSKRGWLVT